MELCVSVKSIEGSFLLLSKTIAHFPEVLKLLLPCKMFGTYQPKIYVSVFNVVGFI